MKIFILLLFTFLTTLFFAQNTAQKELDVLKKKIRQSSYFDSAAVFQDGKKAIQLARKLSQPNEEAIIYQYYGDFYYFSNQYEDAVQNYNKAILRGERFSSPLSFEDRIACSEYFDDMKKRQTA